MDELERQLIIELENNPRQSNRMLAKNLSTSEATIRKKIDMLVSSKTIMLTALSNLKRLGFPIRAFIMFRVEHSQLNEISEKIRKLPKFWYVCCCVGYADIFTRGEFSSITDIADFIRSDISQINGILSIETFVEYQEIKRTYCRIGCHDYSKNSHPEISKYTLDNVDHRLIIELQKNARASQKDLAKCIGVSETTICRHLKELVDSGLIELTAVPNPPIIRYSISYILLQTKPSLTSIVISALGHYTEVDYIGLISGASQVLLGTHSTSSEKLSNFITQELIRIDGIIKVDVLTFLQALKLQYMWLP
jgi:Lrp/AsnC family transcriptional regulator, regulator for asnA, asnC and gidA